MANWQLLRDEMFKINFDGVIFGDINAFREINASGESGQMGNRL
jgi:hypothetical protein